MVNTAASEATAAAEGGGGTGRSSSSLSAPATGVLACGGAAGLLCPQATIPNRKLPNRKHTSQQLRISGRLRKQLRNCKLQRQRLGRALFPLPGLRCPASASNLLFFEYLHSPVHG